jgi:hypothetical protein
MRGKNPETHRNENFERRLKQTMDSELEPEMITPNTAGAEDLPDYVDKFPLVEQFNQTNMRSPKGRSRDHDKQNNEK